MSGTRYDMSPMSEQISETATAGPKLAELPVTFRLPKVGERDPHFGLSRSWYYGEEAEGKISLIRLRNKGKKRGVTLVRSSDVLTLIGA